MPTIITAKPHKTHFLPKNSVLPTNASKTQFSKKNNKKRVDNNSIILYTLINKHPHEN